MAKKISLAAAILAAGLLFQVEAHAGSIIQCDPNATGSTAYPNVSCTSNGAINVNATVSQSAGSTAGAVTDGSGTITTGNTSQQVFSANSTRRYLFIQNTSAGNLWINFGTSATEGSGAGSIIIFPNSSFVMEQNAVTNQTVNINGQTAGQSFVAKQM